MKKVIVNDCFYIDRQILYKEIIMRNFEWCVYTYKHRRAFIYIVDKLISNPMLKQEMLKRAKVHDMDKMLMYLFLDQITSQKIHVQNQPHHLESGKGNTYYDLVETVIDYECAPYTKPDKPLNAYDFTKKLLEMGYLEREKADRLFEIMHDFGIDRSYKVTEDLEGLAYMDEIGEVTEEMILLEVLKYVDDNRNNELKHIENIL